MAKIGDVKTPCCSDAGCCPVESAKGEVGKWCVRKYKGENMCSVFPPKKQSDVCYKCKEGITTYDDWRVVSIPVAQCCTQ